MPCNPSFYSEIVLKPWDRQERTVGGEEFFNWIIPGPNAGATQMLNTDMYAAVRSLFRLLVKTPTVFPSQVPCV